MQIQLLPVKVTLQQVFANEDFFNHQSFWQLLRVQNCRNSMNKNKQTPGKNLSRNEMKKLQGGAAGIRCKVTADCPNVCTPDSIQGNYCVNGLCKYLYCP
jgi:hypothetical protein